MNLLSICAQILIAMSIGFVWIVRFDNIVREFKQYGIPDLLRNFVGASKIAMSTLLIAGIWYESLVLVPALFIAFMMICSQFFHFRIKNPWHKFVPSFLLLLLCLFVAIAHSNMIKLHY